MDDLGVMNIYRLDENGLPRLDVMQGGTRTHYEVHADGSTSTVIRAAGHDFAAEQPPAP